MPTKSSGWPAKRLMHIQFISPHDMADVPDGLHSIDYLYVYTFCSLINASIPGTLICVVCSKFSEFHSELLFHDAMEFMDNFYFRFSFMNFSLSYANCIWYWSWKGYFAGHFVSAFLFINVFGEIGRLSPCAIFEQRAFKIS